MQSSKKKMKTATIKDHKVKKSKTNKHQTQETTEYREHSDGADEGDNSEDIGSDFSSVESTDEMLNTGTTAWWEYLQDPLYQSNAATVYHITALIYHAGTRPVAHPSVVDIKTYLHGVELNEEVVLEVINRAVIQARTQEENHTRAQPGYFDEVHRWVRRATDENTVEMAEAYKVLGLFYAVTYADTRTWWQASGNWDHDRLLSMIDELALSDCDRDTLESHLNQQQRLNVRNRTGLLDAEFAAILGLLDGVAEEEANKVHDASIDPVALLWNYMDQHVKACDTWTKVVKGTHSTASTLRTLEGSKCSSDTYNPLPDAGTAPLSVLTLQEDTTAQDQAKMIRIMNNQRGRVHLIPSNRISPWPRDEAIEVTTARESFLDKITMFDTTLICTRLIQIHGIKKPVLTDQDKMDPTCTVKSKIQRDIERTLSIAGGFALDMGWFNQHWAQIFRSGGGYQTEAIYVVIARREYFGTVGTYGTTQTDLANRTIPFGMQGSGRCIHDMCQMVTSEFEYTEYEMGRREEERKSIRYYRQYWVVAMDSTCKPEVLFNTKSGPLLAVFRGLHTEPESKTELAVELLAIRHWLRERTVLDKDAGIILDQIMHTGKLFPNGRYIELGRNDSEFFGSKGKVASDRRGYKLERNSELVVSVRFAGGALGLSGESHPEYVKLKAMISEVYETKGPYVNALGIRLEMFPSYAAMLKQRVHVPAADVPHRTYVQDVVDNILARDFVEEMLRDPTKTNWWNLPNATQVFYQAKGTTIQNQKVSARMTIVWRDVIDPGTSRGEEAAQQYLRQTNHAIDLNNVAAHLSSTKVGGASCSQVEEDTRTRYCKIGNMYRKPAADSDGTGTTSPMASPPRKKTNNTRTPDRSIVQTFRTPMSAMSTSLSSSNSTGGSTGSTMERYNPETAQLSTLLSKLTTDIHGMQAQITTMNTSMASMQSAHMDLDKKVAEVTSRVGSNSQLKPILRTIKQLANTIVGTQQRVGLLTARLAAAENDGTRLELQLEQSKLTEHRSNLVDHREDAIALASEEGVVLTDEQLRSDV